jgi:hypothetical protein
MPVTYLPAAGAAAPLLESLYYAELPNPNNGDRASLLSPSTNLIGLDGFWAPRAFEGAPILTDANGKQVRIAEQDDRTSLLAGTWSEVNGGTISKAQGQAALVSLPAGSPPGRVRSGKLNAVARGIEAVLVAVRLDAYTGDPIPRLWMGRAATFSRVEAVLRKSMNTMAFYGDGVVGAIPAALTVWMLADWRAGRSSWVWCLDQGAQQASGTGALPAAPLQVRNSYQEGTSAVDDHDRFSFSMFTSTSTLTVARMCAWDVTGVMPAPA